MASAAQLPTRQLGRNGPDIPALGFGLMGLSGTYGAAGPDEERLKVLDRAWELGLRNWDTADLYGDSEQLLGKWFKLHPERRADIFLATKFGLRLGELDGKRGLLTDSTPENCRARCEASLERLGVDFIDLYYIHRVDERTPIEKTMKEMIKLRNESKIKYLGISAASSNTIRRASAVAEISAVQVEYSPFNMEIEREESTHLLKTCRELGIAVFAYSPIGRGLLTGQIQGTENFEPFDLRRLVPWFNEENFSKNLALVNKIKDIAAAKGCTPAQLAIAWLMAQGDDIIPIPGTKKIKYLEENVASVDVKVTAEEDVEIRRLIDGIGVSGDKIIPSGELKDFGDTPAL